jgi:integrase/recombinase XerD
MELVAQSSLELLNDDRKMLSLFLDMKRKRSAQTARAYESTLTRFLNYMNKPMRFVTLADIVEYAKSLEHLSVNTQYRMLSTIKSWFLFLSRQPNYLIANPAAALELPRKQETNILKNTPTKSEIERIANALKARNRRNWLIFTLLYSTGLRISEAVGAKWSDVFVDYDGRIGLVVNGKGGKTRTVKIDKRLFKHIVQYRIDNGLNAEICSGDDSPLFPNRNGSHMTVRYFEKVLTDIVQKLGINKNITPHRLRSFNATYSLFKGANIKVVQSSLGHANISTTNRYLDAINNLDETTSDYVDLEL